MAVTLSQLHKLHQAGKPKEYELALALTEAREAKLHKSNGYSWEGFTEQVGINNRVAQYMVANIRHQQHLKYTEKQIRGLWDHFGYSNLAVILAGLKKKESPVALVKKYGHMNQTQLKGRFAIKSKRPPMTSFTAQITEAQSNKLYGLLEKKYGLAKSKGKKEKVGDAFSDLLNWVFDKHKV